MSAVKIQSPQLSVERGPTHTERFGRRRDIALGSRECPLQPPAPPPQGFRSLSLTYSSLPPRAAISAGRPGKFQLPDAPRGWPYNKIVLIGGHQGSSHLIGNRNDENTRVRIGQTKTFRLDACCRVTHRRRDKTDKILDQFGPARRNIERCNETPLMITNWSGRAAQ
jgi:hypothetical protein